MPSPTLVSLNSIPEELLEASPEGMADHAESDRQEQLEELLPGVLNTLSGREQEVVRRRYGLSRLSVQSLAEVGSLLGISRERVRQIQEKAKEKIEQSLRALTMGEEQQKASPR